MRHTLTSGFTIAELIIVIAVSGILAGILFSPLDDLYYSNINGIQTISQVTDTHSSLRALSSDLNLATGFASTVAVVSPLGANNDATAWNWQGSDSNHRVLIASMYATSLLPGQDTAGARTLVTIPADCSTPMTVTYVYFVRGTTLYRRIMGNNSATCSGVVIAQKQTCAQAVVSGLCNGIDGVVLNNISKFSVDYYATSTINTPIVGEYSSPLVPAAAKSIVLTITSTIGTGNSATSETNTMRITPLNEGP